MRGLWTAQALTLCFFVCYEAHDGGWRESLSASLVLILTPLPLLAVGWLMGAAEVLTLLAGVLLLVAGSALLMLAAHGIARLTRGGLLSHNLLAFLQIMGGSVVVATRGSLARVDGSLKLRENSAYAGAAARHRQAAVAGDVYRGVDTGRLLGRLAAPG